MAVVVAVAVTVSLVDILQLDKYHLAKDMDMDRDQDKEVVILVKLQGSRAMAKEADILELREVNTAPLEGSSSNTTEEEAARQ